MTEAILAVTPSETIKCGRELQAQTITDLQLLGLSLLTIQSNLNQDFVVLSTAQR